MTMTHYKNISTVMKKNVSNLDLNVDNNSMFWACISHAFGAIELISKKTLQIYIIAAF